MKILFNYQLEASYLINEYLQDNKICILSGKSGIGKKYLIKEIECDFNKYPIIENAYTIKDLYSQLLFFNNEQVNANLDIGVGNTIQANIPITQILNKFQSFIKSDFNNLEDKIVNELNNITKKNNLLFSIQLYKNTSDNLIDFIFNRLIGLDIHLIIIVDEEDAIYLKKKTNFQSIPNVIVDCKIDEINSIFENLLSKNDIKKMLSMTCGKIKYIIEIYNYLTTSPSNDFIDYSQLKISHIKDENIDAYNLLEFLSYFKDDFSKNEIKYIHNRLYDEIRIYSELNSILKYIKENNILEENNSIFHFVLSLFKQIIKQNNKDDKKFYKVIGDCIKELYPLDLNGQSYYYARAEDEYLNIVKWFNVIRLVRNKIFDEELMHIINSIENSKIKQISTIIANAYKEYYDANYNKALNILSKINNSEYSSISNEASYLTALCYWKKSDEFKSNTYKILETIISDPNTFEETVLLSKLSLLSIYSNDAQYHNINSYKLYNELKNYINQKISQDLDYKLLLNILRRKSNSVFSSKECVNDLKSSFDYFNEHKNIFFEEFAMSLCNYCAVLLNLGEFDKSLDCYRTINWNRLNSLYKLYNYNNYLLSVFFANKMNVSNIMTDKIDKYELLLKTSQMSIDTKILTQINLAGLKIYEEKYDEAEELYKSAEKMNNGYDDYFDYLINRNKCILAIIHNDYSNAEILFNHLNYIPKLFSAYEKQYLRKRDEVLLEIVQNKEENLTISTLSNIIDTKLDTEFITNNTKFFSTAILFSDIQFWTDN